MRASSITPDHLIPLWQSSEWAAALRGIGRSAAVEPMGDVGQALVLSRRILGIGPVRFASRGPVWAGEATFSDRVQALRAARLHIVNPDRADFDVMHAAGFVRLMQPKQVALMLVARDEDAQIAQARGKWRNAYRQGQRQKLLCTVERFHDLTHGWIFAKDREQQRQKGFRTLPPLMVQAFDNANTGCVDVCLAWHGEQPIAAMIFLRHGAMATYHIGWTSEIGRAVRAHHGMMIEAAQSLGRKGVRVIDLGGYDPVAAPGLARFKRGTGAQVHTLGGTWLRRPFG